MKLSLLACLLAASATCVIAEPGRNWNPGKNKVSEATTGEGLFTAADYKKSKANKYIRDSKGKNKATNKMKLQDTLYHAAYACRLSFEFKEIKIIVPGRVRACMSLADYVIKDAKKLPGIGTYSKAEGITYAGMTVGGSGQSTQGDTATTAGQQTTQTGTEGLNTALVKRGFSWGRKKDSVLGQNVDGTENEHDKKNVENWAKRCYGPDELVTAKRLPLVCAYMAKELKRKGASAVMKGDNQGQNTSEKSKEDSSKREGGGIGGEANDDSRAAAAKKEEGTD